MIICDFCSHRSEEGSCGLGLKIPKTMKCHDFAPDMQNFCAKPSDFTGVEQIVEMAKFFGIEKTELKKVKVIAERRALGDLSPML